MKELDELDVAIEAESVIAFLRDNMGLYYCDGCLNDEAFRGKRNEAREIMQELLANERVFDQGTACDRCDRNKKSIAFLPRV